MLGAVGCLGQILEGWLIGISIAWSWRLRTSGVGPCPSFTRRALTDCNLLVLETENLSPARLQGSAPHPSWGGGGRLGTGDPCREEVGGEQRKSCLAQTQGRAPPTSTSKGCLRLPPLPGLPLCLEPLIPRTPPLVRGSPHCPAPLQLGLLLRDRSVAFARPTPPWFANMVLSWPVGTGLPSPHGLCRLRTSLTSKHRSECSLGPFSTVSVASSSHPGPLR